MIQYLLNFSILPQAIMLLMICVVLLVSAFCPKSEGWVYLFSQAAILLTVSAIVYIRPDSMFIQPIRRFITVFVLVLVSLSFVFAREYNDEHLIPKHEFFILGLLSTLGMMVLISASNLVSAYLGIELMSLPIVAMIALRRVKPRCLEASMKFFVTSAVASGLLLYGFSFLFGITHSVEISKIMQYFTLHPQPTLLVWVALAAVLSSLLFKLGVAPFHSWVADVYDGAPNSVTLFMSSAPKVAVMIFLLFFLASLHSLDTTWQMIVVVMALMSIAIGNLVAIVQTNMKRLLAYSSVAHMGYALLGIYGINAASHSLSLSSPTIFYIVTYSVMSLAAFGLLVVLSRLGEEVTEIKSLSGLANRQPWLAFLMLLTLFSMAGLPPLLGFIAKINILELLVRSGHVYFAVYAIFFAIIGAYYYIRVIKVMYFESGDNVNEVERNLYPTSSGYLAMTITGFSLLLVGIFPAGLLQLCHLVSRWV
jgi:NADH-quinone oxidoreductase subunit N